MENIISKELLSEVMQLNILEVGEVDDCYLSFKYYILDDDCIDACINIYELTNKCKQTAYNLNKGVTNKYNYYLWSGIDHNGKWNCFATEFNSFDEFSTCIEQNILPYIYQNTEYEAVFSACQWILENKGIK